MHPHDPMFLLTMCVLAASLLAALPAADALEAAPDTELVAGLQVPREDGREFGAHLQHTMRLLAASTAEHPSTVRILCYGQSIMQGGHVSTWMTQELVRRYPTVRLVVENRSIGGYTAPGLVRTAPSDIVPFRPDLVALHVYWGETDGTFEGILRIVRDHTNADLLTWTHHLDAFNDDERRELSASRQRDLVRRHGGEVVEVRDLWRQTLALNTLERPALLRDNIHLNDQGGAVLTALVARHFFVYDGPTPAGERGVSRIALAGALGTSVQGSGTVSTTPAGVVLAGVGSRLRIPFTGNRIDVIGASGAGRLRVLVDGKVPSLDQSTLTTTRCSPTPGCWFPTLNRVALGANAVPETWTMTCTGTGDLTTCDFTVAGSVTGADGGGQIGKPFTSISGRISIDPKDITLASARSISGKPLPESVTATWQVVSMGVDGLAATALAEGRPQTVWQSWQSGSHILELCSEDDAAVTIEAAVVYDPSART